MMDLQSIPIDVICSVHNGLPHIIATVDSIVEQTHKNWNFIIVDDGSTDGTAQLLQERYAARDPRIRVITAGRIGRGRALNLAWNASHAEYVCNIDADDPSHPSRLDASLRAMLRFPELGAVGTAAVLLKDDQIPQWEPHLSGDSIENVTNMLTIRNPLLHSSIMFRREALDAVNGYSEILNRLFDYDLYVRLAHAGYVLGRINHRLASKRFHSKQNFEIVGRPSYVVDSIRVQLRAIKLLNGGFRARLSILPRLVWGLLPNWIRNPLKLRF